MTKIAISIVSILFLLMTLFLCVAEGYQGNDFALRVPLATGEGFGFDFKYCLDIDKLQLEIDPETASKEMFRKIVNNFVDKVSQYEIPVPKNTILNVSLSTTEVRIWLRTFLYNGYDSIVMSKKKGRLYAYVMIEKGNFVYVVEDEGGGIPEDQIGRIFNSPINSFKGDVDLTGKHLFGGCGAALCSMASLVRRYRW